MVAPPISPERKAANGRGSVNRSGLSKLFRVGVEKLPCSRRGIGAMASTIESAESTGASDANWPYCGRKDSKLFALLSRNLAANLD
jgi:hypothetical protein